MPTIEYPHVVPYTADESTGRLFPRILISLSNPQNPDLAVDTHGYLDSGAECSLFQAPFALALELDLTNGKEFDFGSSMGTGGVARACEVVILHDQLGEVTMDIGFVVGLSRNLLGRDFFDQFQIGFREHHQTVYAVRE